MTSTFAVLFLALFVLTSATFTSLELEKAALPAHLGSISKREAPHDQEAENVQLFWFTRNCTVGNATGLNLLMDSGSSNFVLNPHVYKPSAASRKHDPFNFEILYATPTKNKPGFLEVKGETYYDTASVAGLTVHGQVIGSATSFTIAPKHDHYNKPYPGNLDGIVGLGGPGLGPLKNSTPFIPNLFKRGIISQNRIGTAYGTDKRGVQVIGGIDQSLYDGHLTVTRRYRPFDMMIGDIALNDKLVLKNQMLLLDTGTPYIAAPMSQAKKIFDTLNLKIIEMHASTKFGNIMSIKALYPCGNPPTLGFSIPSQGSRAHGSGISKTPKTFNLFPSVWPLNRLTDGSGNCTTILTGQSHQGAWLLGQPFYQGHYVDDNREDGTIGVARLKDPSNVGLDT